MERPRTSIQKWAAAVRSSMRGRLAGRAATRRQEIRLESFEPRILLSADVGLAPEAALGLLAPQAERVEVPVEIHEEVVARELDRSLAADAEALEGQQASEPDAVGTELDSDSGPEPGDPSRADLALQARVWSAELTREAAEARDVDQLVVIDARVPEARSLLSALLESTADSQLGNRDFESGTRTTSAAEPSREAAQPESGVALRAGVGAGGVQSEQNPGVPADSVGELAERGVHVVVLDAERDGLDQVGEILEAYSGAAALHVVSHGASGSLRLGSTGATLESVRQRGESLRAWGHALAPGGDILLYGCDVADGEVGIEFLATLSELTGADLAASTDATGGSAAGGDWDLEASFGAVEATPISAPAFAALLADATGTQANETFTVTYDATSLQWSVNGVAIAPAANLISIDSGGGDDSLDIQSVDPAFTGTIELTGTGAAERLTLLGVDPAFQGTVRLSGGDGDDTYEIAASSWNQLELNDSSGNDLADFGGREAGGTLTFDTSIDEVMGLGLGQNAVQELLAGLDALVDWARKLNTAGDLGSPLAGLKGNVDVTLGAAMDIADALEQLQLAVQAANPQTTDELVDALSGLHKQDVQHLSRAIVGDVLAPVLNGEGFGFVVQLDDASGVHLGSAASLRGAPDLSFEVRLTGVADLSFIQRDGDPDTVRRSAGSWTADGFRVGQSVQFGNSAANTLAYTITGISGDGRELTVREDLVGESVAMGTAAASNTVFRSAGSWLDDGFRARQEIEIGGTASNSGIRSIDSISEDGRVLVLSGGVVTHEAAVAGASVSGRTLTGSDAAELVKTINERIDSSPLVGRVEAVLTDLRNGSASETSRVAFQVSDVSVDRLRLDVTESASVLGFSTAGPAQISDLIQALDGLGDLAARIFRGPVMTNLADVAGASVVALGGGAALTGTPMLGFTAGRAHTGSIMRDDGAQWSGDGFASGDVIAVSGAGAADGLYRVTSGTGASAIQVERVFDLSGASAGGATTLVRNDGANWDADGFETNQTLTVSDGANSARFTIVGGVDSDTLSLVPLGGGVAPAWFETDFVGSVIDQPVALQVDASSGTPMLTLRFDYSAERMSRFGIGLGELADEKGVTFDANAALDLASSLQATLALDLTLGGNPVFAVDVEALEVAGRVDPVPAQNVAAGTSVDIGFLGAEIDSQGGSIALDARLVLPGSATQWTGLGSSELQEADAAVASRAAELSRAAQALVVQLPVKVKDGLAGQVGPAPGSQILISATRDAFAGKMALQEADFVEFASIQKFANIDAPKFVQLLGQVRDGLDRLRQLLNQLQIPFVQGAVGKVADVADAFGDAVLFDDGDDGADADDPNKLVTDLNGLLAQNDLDDLVRFLVRPKDGATRIELEAIDASVRQLELTPGGSGSFGFVGTQVSDGSSGVTHSGPVVVDASGAVGTHTLTRVGDWDVDGFAVGQFVTIAAGSRFSVSSLQGNVMQVTEDLSSVASGPLSVSVLSGLPAILAEMAAPATGTLAATDSVSLAITVTTIDGDRSVTLDLDSGDTAGNTGVGNDVEKLLDANNAATFRTAQELRDKLFGLVSDAVGFDAMLDGDLLTYKIDLSAAFPDVQIPVGFDLDLDPLGEIRTLGDPKLTLGGEVGFEITIGVDLGDLQGDIANARLADLRDIDGPFDVIARAPAATASSGPSADTVENEEIEIDRVRAASDALLELVVGAAQSVLAESIVADVLSLTSAVDTRLNIGVTEQSLSGGGRTVFFSGVAAPSQGFSLRIDTDGGATFGEITDVVVAAPDGTSRATQIQNAIDTALGAAGLVRVDSVINGVVSLSSTQANTVLMAGATGDRLRGNGQSIIFKDLVDYAFRSPDLDFWLRIDDTSGQAAVNGTAFQVTIPGKSYAVATERAYELRFLQDIERAIRDAQGSLAVSKIVRSAGSWSAEGFAAGQQIELGRTTHNDGVYRIKSIDSTGRELVVEENFSSAEAQTSGLLVEGPGTLRLTRPGAEWEQLGVDAGERVALSGSLRNDGSYLVESIDDNDKARAILSTPLDPEPASDQFEVRTTGGVLQPAAGSFDVHLAQGTSASVQIPDGSDNQNLADLVADLQQALDDSGLGEGTIRVGSTDARLVFTLAAARPEGEPELSLVDTTPAGSATKTATLTREASEGNDVGSWIDDGFVQGMLVRVVGAAQDDGVYRINAAPTDTSLSLERVIATAPIAADGLLVEEFLPALTAAPGATPTTLDFAPAGSIVRSGGSFLDEGFEDGQFISVAGTRDAGNDGTYRILDVVSATELSVVRLSDAGGAAAAAIGTELGASGAILARTFFIEGGGALGFDQAGQYADLHDLSIVLHDASVGGSRHHVSLDGVTTVAELQTRIENATGQAVRVVFSDDGTRLRLVAPATFASEDVQLTFADGAAGADTITRLDGRAWSADGFQVGQAIRVGSSLRNDGLYVISAFSGANGEVLEIAGTGADALAGEVAARGVTVTAVQLEQATAQVAFEDMGEADQIRRLDAGGSWIQDGFRAGDRIRVGGSGPNAGAYVVDQVTAAVLTLRRGQSLTNATPAAPVSVATDARGEAFRVETINLSPSALRLGIQRADAEDDVSNDSEIDQKDGDGVIEGGVITATSLFDRFFIRDEELSLTLTLDAPTGGIDVLGSFGFFEAQLNGSGNFQGVASIEFDDSFDANADQRLSLTEIGKGLRNLRHFIDTPKFAGASIETLQGQLTFATNSITSVAPASGARIDWLEEGFRPGQMIEISGSPTPGVDGRYRIADTATAVTADTLTLADPLGISSPVTQSQITIAGAMGTLVFTLDKASLGDFAALADVAANPEVRVLLWNIGDPFFDEEVDLQSRAATEKKAFVVDALPSGVEIGDEVEIAFTDAQGQAQSAQIQIVALTPLVGGTQVRVELQDEFVDSISNVKLERATFTKPPEFEIQTPDLGGLLDWNDIGFRDILRGLIALSDFLSQYEEFGFLAEPIPLVDVSFNDLLAYADRLAQAVEHAENDPAGSLQSLEAKLEELLGIDPSGPFDVSLDLWQPPASTPAATPRVLRIALDVGAGFQKSLGLDFDLGLGDAAMLSGAAGLRAAGTANLQLAFGLDIEQTQTSGQPGLQLRSVAGSNDTLRRLDGVDWASEGFRLGQTLELEGSANNDGEYEIAGLQGDTLLLAQAIQADEDVVADTAHVTGQRAVSLLESTGIEGSFLAGAADVNFRGAVGPLGLFVKNGLVQIGGVLPGASPHLAFRAGLDFDTQPGTTGGAIVFSALDLAQHFTAQAAVGIDAALPVYFPTDSTLSGSVVYENALSVDATTGDFELLFPLTGSSALRAVDGMGQPIAVGDLFDIDNLLGSMSIFDNILLAVEGIDLFLGGLQDVLDGEVFGIELPLIGDSLSEGATFIQDLRDDFVDPFRDAVENAEDFADGLNDSARPDPVTQLLFDLLEPTGLLLVDHDGDPTNDDITATQEGLARGDFQVADAIQAVVPVALLNAPIDEVRQKLRDGTIEIRWNMKLGQSLLDADIDLDIDLGIPGLGFEAQGPLGLALGWDLEFGFGLNFDEGFFLDISSPDELEVAVDVTLPDRLAGQLAFLQLDAVNTGSVLQATFGINVSNGSDSGDTKLSFGELGKLKLDAGIQAQAVADFALQLQLNSDLIPGAASVFPTVSADFLLDWHVGAADDFELSAANLSIQGESVALLSHGGSWIAEGFLPGQTLQIGADVLEIEAVSEDGATLTLSAAPTLQGAQTLDVTGLASMADLSTKLFMQGLHTVEFTDISLDLGSFISDFIDPVLGSIKQFTEPIQPIVDFLTSPVPVISDLGPPTTLIDLAALTGKVNPALLYSLADVISLINSIPTGRGEVQLGFGDLVIFSREQGMGEDLDLTNPNADLSAVERKSTRSGVADVDQQLNAKKKNESAGDKQAKSFAQRLRNTEGLSFPILSDPTQVFGLFLGDEVTLIGYDMPPLDLELSYTQLFPIYPPLFVSITGTVSAHIDFAFGFDTSGIQKFADTGFKNPLLIFDGFYISDNPLDATGAGPDGVELILGGSISAAAELNVGFARGGAGGGIFIEVEFDLYDPNRDGKVRISEILESIEAEVISGNPLIAPLALFDVSGEITAKLFAFIEINLLITSFELEFDITPPITVVDFEIDFVRPPKLATELPDGVLQLNIGDFSEQRLNGDTRDIGETIRAKTEGGSLKVWSDQFGISEARAQSYALPRRIIASGGAGRDVIDLSRVTGNVAFDLQGGAGNDDLIAGSAATGGGEFRGGLGSDRIVGSAGADLIYGDEGNDVIAAGGGADVVFADGGRVSEGSVVIRRVELELVGGNQILRSDGVDWAREGFAVGQEMELKGSELGSDGTYVVAGVQGATLTLTLDGLSPNFTAEQSQRIKLEVPDTEFVRSYKASARDSDGDDIVFGGTGDDWIFGAGGADVLVGGGPDVLPASLDPALVPSDSDPTGDDFLIGDGGEIRFRHNGEIRAVEATNRAIGAGADRLFGSGGDDVIYAGQGDDEIDGGDGADEIHAEDGFDTATGGAGDDLVLGGRDADVLRGGADDDELRGGTGDDRIFGEAGDDRLLGELGADSLDGGSGDDTLRGGSDPDLLVGGTGDDDLDGGGGDDSLLGDTTLVGELQRALESAGLAGDVEADIDRATGHLLLRTVDEAITSLRLGLSAGDAGGFAALGFDDGATSSAGVLAAARAFDRVRLQAGAAGLTLEITTASGSALHALDVSTAGPADLLNAALAASGLDAVIAASLDATTGRVVLTRLDSSAGFSLTAAPFDPLDPTLPFDRGGFAALGFTAASGTSAANDADLERLSRSDAVLEFTIDGVLHRVVIEADGRDTLRTRIGSDNLDAQVGSDQYVVGFKGGENDSRYPVFDSGTSQLDTDVLTVNGTDAPDHFLLRAAENPQGFAFIASINALATVERLDYAGIERIVVNGLGGDDRFSVDDARAEATLNGDAGADFFQVAQIYRSPRTVAGGNIDPDDEFATIVTTRGFLSNGTTAPMVINGGPDDDLIHVFHNLEVLQVNGDAGDDTVVVRSFALQGSREELRDRTDISGGAGFDSIQYAVNAPVNIDGGDGLDTVKVIGTEFSDDYVITSEGVFGAGRFVTLVNVELLEVDGAEGDDRFFVRSTSDKVITKIVGGLGSDTFNVAGDTPPVISNDLLGHSGVITHDIESFDPLYSGVSGTGIAAPGISANVADQDEPAIVVTQTQGSTRVVEGGRVDWYTIVLARKPTQRVVVTALAPLQNAEQMALGALAFSVSGPDSTLDEPDGTATKLVFDDTNWDVPQVVTVQALRPTAGGSIDRNFDDSAFEGERFAVINHTVMSEDAIAGDVSSLAESSETDAQGRVRLLTTLSVGLASGSQPFPSDVDALLGRKLRIVSGEGIGQSLLVEGSVVSADGQSAVLTLAGRFQAAALPSQGTGYLIEGYAALALPSVTVQIDDNDAADVLIHEAGSLLFGGSVVSATAAGAQTILVVAPTPGQALANPFPAPTDALVGAELRILQGAGAGQVLRVVGSSLQGAEGTLVLDGRFDPAAVPDTRSSFEVVAAGTSDASEGLTRVFEGGLPDRYEVVLSRVPSDTVRVELSVDASLGGQVLLSASPGGPASATLVLDFAPSGAGLWSTPQVVYVTAAPDGDREGFHRGFIHHRVLPGTADVDQILGIVDDFKLVVDPLDASDPEPRTSVQLSRVPVVFTAMADAGSTASLLEDLDASFGAEVIGHTVRITGGTGAGQAALVVGRTATTLSLDRSWADAPDATSEYQLLDLVVRVDGADHADSVAIGIRADGAIERSAGSWLADGFAEGQTIQISGAPGNTGLYTIVERTEMLLRVQEPLVAAAASANIDVKEVAERDPERWALVSSTVFFLDAEGRPELLEAESVKIAYDTLERGYAGRSEERISVQVVDDDTAGVLVTETGHSTNVTEGGSEDTYQIVLSRQPGLPEDPSQPLDPNATVEVTVQPTPTKTSRGAVRLADVDPSIPGIVQDANGFITQVSVEAVAGQAPGARVNADGSLTLVFTASNWNLPQTVRVRAIEDGRVDGGDTKVFAPAPHVIGDVQGPLLIDGGIGQSAKDGIPEAVLLPGETNRKVADGAVLQARASSLDVATVDLSRAIAAFGAADAQGLVGRTVEIVEGAGLDQFSEIVSVEELDATTTRLHIAPDWPLDAAELASVSKFLITSESPNFFAHEPEQIDILIVNDEDSPADSSGVLTTLDLSRYSETAALLRGAGPPGHLHGFGTGPDTLIAGALRPGGITYSQLEGLDIRLGSGDNQLDIDAFHYRDDGFRTFTTVSAGDGDDRIQVSSQVPTTPGAGVPFVELRGDEGDDVVDASASNQPLVIIGGLGADTLTGSQAGDVVYGDFGAPGFGPIAGQRPSLREPPVPPAVLPDVGTERPGEGAGDTIDGQGGDDLLFGGAGDDAILGGDGDDVAIGDYGRVRDPDARTRLIETTDFFQGGNDGLVAGTGNNFLLGGFGADFLTGDFRRDVIVGEYARVTLVDGRITTVVRLGQGSLDVAASSLFDLYDPLLDPFSPSARVAAAAVRSAEFDEALGLGELTSPRALNQGSGPPTFGAGAYEVVEGDTLWDIAGRHLGDPFRWPEIFALNGDGIDDPDLIEPGDRVRLPGAGEALVAQPSREFSDPAAALQALAAAEARANEAPGEWTFSYGGEDTAGVAAGPEDAERGDAGRDEDGGRDEESQRGDGQDESGASSEAGSRGDAIAALWAGLTRWRVQKRSARGAGQERWLAFDADKGDFELASCATRNRGTRASAARAVVEW